MLQTDIYNFSRYPSQAERSEIVQFLSIHLEQYGDKEEDIDKAFNYAISANVDAGGYVIALRDNENDIVGASIVNRTGMEGYIPENILVYIATHREHRGKGIASNLMQEIVNTSEGDIALHVEPDNPAIGLYKKFGFTNKYLEMRLKKEN